jgi:two-component system sensor histidine kinase VicK
VGARNNNTVVSLFPLRFDSGAALKTPLTMLGSFNNDDENLAAKDYRGQQAIGVAKSIGFADWILATKMDQKEAFAPVAQLRNTLLSIVVGISLCIIIIALYFTRSFTRPILSLARVSRLIGKGDLSARINFQRQDELGALGQSINAMGLNLKEFVTHIEAERNRLEVILNSTTEGILAIDKNGTIIIANQAAAELTQLSIDMIVGKDIHQTFRWIHSSRPYDINYGTPGNNAYNDLQYVSPAGSIHYVKLIVAQVSSEQEQKAAQTIVTIHDETKSRELENMKIDFVSMAAHELRTPLAATRGYLELISYKGGEHISPDIAKYLHQALKSTSELGGLINNLLDVTRIERGTLTFHPTRLDLAADLAQAVQDARFSAADKHIMLSYNGAANGSFVIADQIAIHEVINNLISNAIKYTPDGGHIEVSLNQNQSQYIVDVKDTGIGIPKAAMANLFTKFYRVHGGLNSGSTGTGLGLFIAKSIIERHGGTITVESQEGIGSVFTFMLPISNGTDSVTGLSQSPTPTYDEATLRRHRGWTTKNITR